jgi:hypothetical protein
MTISKKGIQKCSLKKVSKNSIWPDFPPPFVFPLWLKLIKIAESF